MIPIKNAREIEKMRQACRTASDILHQVSDLIRPGIITKDVDEAAADFMSEARVKSAFLGYRLGHRVFRGNRRPAADRPDADQCQRCQGDFGGVTQEASFRGGSNHRTRSLEIPGLDLRTIPE